MNVKVSVCKDMRVCTHHVYARIYSYAYIHMYIYIYIYI